MFTHSSLPVHPLIQLAHAGAEDHSQVSCVPPAAARPFRPELFTIKPLSQKSQLRIFARNLLQFGIRLLSSHCHVNRKNRHVLLVLVCIFSLYEACHGS